MISGRTKSEKAGYAIVGAIALLAVGVWGSRAVQRPAEIKFVDGKADASPPQGLLQEPAKRAAPAPVDTEILVHVVGAVKSPGLLKFQPGDRVADAIEQAGGGANADLESLNLAAKLVDGTQLVVPKKGAQPVAALNAEPAEPESPYSGGNRTSSSYSRLKGSSAKAGSGLAPGSISLNEASLAQLDRLPGVGPSTAKKILDYRMAHGGFSSIDEVMNVKGIGPKKFADMKKYLRL